MNPSPRSEGRPQSAVLISTIVVLNIICWMVMIAAVGLGATHLNRCPLQPNIPLYLVVLGATGLFSMTMTYTKDCCGEGKASIMCSFCLAMLHLFHFVWFITGTTWIYPVYPPDYTPGTLRYCQKTTYLFAFAVITIMWSATVFVLVFGCCFAVVVFWKGVAIRRTLRPWNWNLYGATSDSQEPTAGDV